MLCGCLRFVTLNRSLQRIMLGRTGFMYLLTMVLLYILVAYIEIGGTATDTMGNTSTTYGPSLATDCMNFVFRQRSRSRLVGSKTNVVDLSILYNC